MRNFSAAECGKTTRGNLRNVPHLIFRKLPLDNFPHSSIRIPQNTRAPTERQKILLRSTSGITMEQSSWKCRDRTINEHVQEPAWQALDRYGQLKLYFSAHQPTSTSTSTSTSSICLITRHHRRLSHSRRLSRRLAYPRTAKSIPSSVPSSCRFLDQPNWTYSTCTNSMCLANLPVGNFTFMFQHIK